MDKNQLLSELALKLQTGEIRVEEVRGMLPVETVSPVIPERKKHVPFVKILYIIGALIALTGIVVFFAQIWDDIGSIARIFITLVLGLVFSVFGSLFILQQPEKPIGAIFHVLGGTLLPAGAVITLYEMGLDSNELLISFAYIALGVFYIILNVRLRHPVIVFFALMNMTVGAYIFLEAIMPRSYRYDDEMYAYLTMAIGIGYMLFGRAFVGTKNAVLTGTLYGFGSLGFLGALFSQIIDHHIGEVLFFGVLFGGVYLSTRIKSSSILVMSTIFLVIHIGYITAEYFANSVGWPLALVFLGFVLIGIAYMSIKVNRQYINP